MGKAAVHGQNREQPVLHERDALTVKRAGHIHKAHVYAPVGKPLLHIIVVPVFQDKIHIGVIVLKLLQDPRQPVDCDRGEGADAHGAVVKPADGGRRLA